ncbi:protein FAM124A-like isoform X1 [Polypterus senegalus]|uniref:protein FAM124A-like isoform X1 n=2 Tax=Polypterus senegalus TaxID=55291 RepID=UPI0019626E65|nr:protein FAM124A-like isoform X1 [Polypterus senegalus]
MDSFRETQSTYGEMSLEADVDSMVTLHLLADPGCGHNLFSSVADLLHKLGVTSQLFLVSEREACCGAPRLANNCVMAHPIFRQPSLAVVFFVQEESDNLQDNRALQLFNKCFSRSPWCYHHTELASSCRPILPYMPGNQDFYSLAGAQDLPLWAIRQVHYGKELLRFSLYCSHMMFSRNVLLYRALLGQEVTLAREGFCCFTVGSRNQHFEVQLALKQLPPEMTPSLVSSAFLEFWVPGVENLNLPKVLNPLSHCRWQTEDYDGNVIVLQVRHQSTSVSHSTQQVKTLQEASQSSPCSSEILRVSSFLPQSLLEYRRSSSVGGRIRDARGGTSRLTQSTPSSYHHGDNSLNSSVMSVEKFQIIGSTRISQSCLRQAALAVDVTDTQTPSKGRTFCSSSSAKCFPEATRERKESTDSEEFYI